MEPWKARVERVQRRTKGIAHGLLELKGRLGGWGGLRTEEHVLEDDGLLGEPAEVACVCAVGGLGVGDGLALDARPGEVDVEEQEEDAEADDGALVSFNALATCPVSLSSTGRSVKPTANLSSSFINVLCSKCLYTCPPPSHHQLYFPPDTYSVSAPAA